MDNTVGEKIKKFRKRAGVSQFELELRINASPGSISRIESGLVNPTKETLGKIITTLMLSPIEAGNLFNIDIGSEIDKYIVVAKSLNTMTDLDSALRLISMDLISYLDGKFAVIFLKDGITNKLKVASINVPPVIKTLCGQFIGCDLDKVSFDLNNSEHTKNFYVKSFLQSELVQTTSVYDASYPLLSKPLADAAQKVASVELIVAVPIMINNQTIGVLGVVLKKSGLSESNKKVIKNFSELISSTIARLDTVNK